MVHQPVLRFSCRGSNGGSDMYCLHSGECRVDGWVWSSFRAHVLVSALLLLGLAVLCESEGGFQLTH